MSHSTFPPNLHHVRGDLLAHDADYIVHQCNCRTTRAWGLAYSLFGSFPHADTYTVPSDPKLAPMPPKRVPGTFTLHGGPGTGLRGVINLYGQDAPGKASAAETKAQRLTWFQNALLQLADVPNLKSVAFPHGIGCGLAGGSWKQYEAALVEFAVLVPETEVYIVQMTTTAPGKLKRSKAVGRGKLKLKRAVKKVVAKKVTTPSGASTQPTPATAPTKRTTATPSGKLKRSKAVGRGEPTSAPTPTKRTTNKAPTTPPHSPRDGA
jgi:O-acetyl-ADP-ribose deacetylase (regulator of RNase III)